MNLPFFTIGHSDRSIEEFTYLLAGADIALVADIRKIPKSRANPQFNAAALAPALEASGIGYERVAELGGLRGKTRAVPPELNGFWTNKSFHNYADYALSDQFRTGLDRLVRDGRERRCATMCSEAVWWRCHRRIVSDYLIARGETVFNIMGQGRLEPARLTEGAVIRDDGSVIYPARERFDS
ncbi:DUF488 domain-containing protein [Bosea sp. AS-1]|uniref:DUF488 domain-containing protein n=1 Tax=Bosea sp. AS-1 TaxID=2015316 RepID=UPI000B78B83B|nr:DUF488 domain-containing protein [Bosea sp. AS-1]